MQCLHQDGWWRFELENVSVADSGTGRGGPMVCVDMIDNDLSQ